MLPAAGRYILYITIIFGSLNIPPMILVLVPHGSAKTIVSCSVQIWKSVSLNLVLSNIDTYFPDNFVK